jgi:hypothetical protein
MSNKSIAQVRLVVLQLYAHEGALNATPIANTTFAHSLKRQALLCDACIALLGERIEVLC